MKKVSIWNTPSELKFYLCIGITCTNKFPTIFIVNWALTVKERNLMFYLNYCRSLATTFSHLSVSIRVPRLKNASYFEAIHESTQFLVFSYDVKCCSDNPCVIDQNKWKSEGAMSGNMTGRVNLPTSMFPNMFWHVDHMFLQVTDVPQLQIFSN